MTTRLRQLKSAFRRNHIDAFLVQKDVNITYLTGFPASESWLLVTRRGSFYITDFRYILEANAGLKGKGVKVVEYKRSIHDALFQLARDQKVKNIGFDERHVTLSQFKALSRKCPAKIKLVKADGIVEELREVKDAHELRMIRKALSIHQEALAYLKRIIKPGISEKEALARLTDFVKARNAGFSFAPIIASGPNSCLPHAIVSNRKVRNNEPVLIDMGIDVGGYKSDLTRMFFLGKIPNLVRQVNEHVYNAQQKAIRKIRAGISIAEVDFEARNYLEGQDLAKYFGHALGHGVGLEIHEDPRLAGQNTAALKEGSVITVEPAVYLPNKFGIRIEDMVLVTKKGCRVLSGHINQ